MSRPVATAYNISIEYLGSVIGAIANNRIRRKRICMSFLTEVLSQVPFAFGWKLRRAVYARVLPRVGHDVVLHHGVTIEDERTEFGSDIWISVGTYIDYVKFEDHVLVGQNVVLLSGKNHHLANRTDIPIKHQGNPPKQPITIGKGAWIGANSTIMADVGNDAIVGAGSVVTKPVPPFGIVAGNPARLIRMRK
jgi:acetyltransferase-like isoleucine patch superfamily enzyme